MITVNEFIDIMNRIANENTQDEWDNSGMQLDPGKKEIERILVCLEINEEIIKEAADINADMIVTHHPLYFNSLKKITRADAAGRYTIDLINNGISVYSAHTDFDRAEKGNNYEICRLLNIKNVKEIRTGKGENDRMGMYGSLECEMTLAEAALKVKNALNTQNGEIRYTGDGNRKVKTAGVCTGAGADLIDNAYELGCDIFITGDVKYHEAQDAISKGISIIDAGHFATENIFAGIMSEQIKEYTGDRVTVIESKININPFNFI